MSEAELTFRPDKAPLVALGGAELHARDMTATFSADVTLADVQGRLAELGQWLPVDGRAERTLGRLIGCNSTGPLRLGHGAWRDLLLGCQFKNGRGELITAGGRTVKNVAGYDLTKFMVGQGDVFGELVTITTRTYRRPEGALLARFSPQLWHVNRLLPTSCRPQWAALTSKGLVCGYLGDARTIDYYRKALPEHRPVELIECSLEEDMRHRAELWRWAGEPGSFRASVPPAKLGEFASAAGLAAGAWSADAAFGIVVGDARASDVTRLRAAARELGGSAHFFDDAGRTRVELDAARRSLLLRLKAAFDPDDKLEPLSQP
jgi:FAD/FMN-containing dehydrogenase